MDNDNHDHLRNAYDVAKGKMFNKYNVANKEADDALDMAKNRAVNAYHMASGDYIGARDTVVKAYSTAMDKVTNNYHMAKKKAENEYNDAMDQAEHIFVEWCTLSGYKRINRRNRYHMTTDLKVATDKAVNAYRVARDEAENEYDLAKNKAANAYQEAMVAEETAVKDKKEKAAKDKKDEEETVTWTESVYRALRLNKRDDDNVPRKSEKKHTDKPLISKQQISQLFKEFKPLLDAIIDKIMRNTVHPKGSSTHTRDIYNANRN
jgi:hypothetical protein